MKCLITGGAGFIGSHLVGYLLENTDWDVMVIDLLTYAAVHGDRLDKYQNHPRFHLRQKDICRLESIERYQDPDYIVHLAAETHVERSIQDPEAFVRANIIGTYRMLQWARRQNNLKKFLYFSTDEVFGSADPGEIRDEDAPFRSGNPYAASKAAGEELALAWGNTYGIPVVISHCSNVFGPNQHSEKFIPKLVQKILNQEKVEIHADAQGHVGSRMYVYAYDVARAVRLLLEKGKTQEKYNIPGFQMSNFDMARFVADELNKELDHEKVRPDVTRPGWDFSYRISGVKLRKLGWEAGPDLHGQLKSTVESYADQTEPKE